MKFGETLYQRSVPKWTAYNLNYNELKKLIKLRTTTGASSPMPIPGQTDHRWSLLEDELFAILKDQYDNIGMFLRSKHGEIERRLTALDKSVRSAKRAVKNYSGRPSLQARRFQRLVQEAESIGEDIQALTRFAAVQKTAFRKILKKYRKWTNTDGLRNRLEADVFADGQLEINVSEQMQHLAAQTSIIHRLETELMQNSPFEQNRRLSTVKLESPVTIISNAADAGKLHFDAAIVTTPFGESAATATYWVHPDNLEEARVLLLRYMRDLNMQEALPHDNSMNDVPKSITTAADSSLTYTCYFDNVYRLLQDQGLATPSRVAMSALWSQGKEALINLSDMSPRSDAYSTLSIRRKDLPVALDREASLPKDNSVSAANVKTIKSFLSQHRDLRPLAIQTSDRTRFVGLNNSSAVGTFATLDSNLSFSSFDKSAILDSSRLNKQGFPHAVLQIRWEFGKRPEVARAFDTTHLAEKVDDFSLETAAVHKEHPELVKLNWVLLLEKDIRKVPMQVRRTRRTTEPQSGTNSAPSSTGDSVFSATLEPSAGSETSPVASTIDVNSGLQAAQTEQKRKKKARIAAQSPTRPGAKYYSEYDDPDSELYQQEAYTIYVDPNAEDPMVAAFRKIGTFFASPFQKAASDNEHDQNERTPLLTERSSHDEEAASSESESDNTMASKPKHTGLRGHVRPAQRYRLRLSRRQRKFEQTLGRISAALVVLSYVLLLMSTVLLATGRRKEYLEVDIGATVGVVAAVVCTLLSLAMTWMRKTPLGKVEKTTLVLADGMVLLLSFAVVVGIVQKARYHKK